jgi:glyoxylase-like metal-dependent hydrolase (beta-lactamase superfamily II)
MLLAGGGVRDHSGPVNEGGSPGRPLFEIVAVRYGTVRSTKGDFYYRFHAYGEPDAPQDMDFFFYVLRGGGETILIDTGFRPDAAPPRGRTCLVAPREALARLGVEPSSVARLVITHFHWDHVGNIDAFADAELFLPDRELEFWGNPVARNLQFWSAIDEEPLARLQAAHRDGRAVVTGADQQIVPGVRAIMVGGHSPGQQIVVVDSARGPVVLASDAVHFYEELELERPFAVAVDLREMCEAYALLKRLAAESDALVVAGHDPAVADRFPSLEGDAAGIAYRIA